MTQQAASATVSLPLAQVQERLQDVGSWPAFLLGVNRITPVAHERYVFEIGEGRAVREISVVLRLDHQRHCFRWHATAGPAFEGTLGLAEVDTGHTRVTLTITQSPAGLRAGLAEMLLPGAAGAQAVIDLQRLESHLAAGRGGETAG